MIKQRNAFLWESLAWFAISVVMVYQWFGSPQKSMLYQVDQFFPFNPQYYLTHMYAWCDLNGTGEPPFYSFSLMPYIGSIYILRTVLNLSLGWSQYVLYVFLFFLGGLGMLLFTRKIYDEELRGSPAPFLAVIFYSLNSYVLVWVITGNNVWFIYAFLPFFLYHIRKGVKVARAGSFPLRDLALASIFLFLMLPGFAWVYLLPASFIIVVYILMLFLMERPSLKYSVLMLAFLLMEGVLLYSQELRWIPSKVSWLLEPSSASTQWIWVLENSRRTTYLTALAMGWLNDVSYPSQTILFTLVLSVFSFVALLHETNKKEFKAYIVFFTSLVLIFVFLIAGVSGPFGGIFTYLWWNVFLFRPFITLLMDFGFVLALAYAVLAPIGIFKILSICGRLRKRQITRGAVMGAISIVLVVGAVPSLFTGSWATTYPPGWAPGARISVPEYEYEVYGFFSAHLTHGQRVLSLPAQSPLTGTMWYHATEVLLFMGVPMFSGGYMPVPNNHIYGVLANKLNTGDTSNFSEALAVLGVKYVMVHLDYNPSSVESSRYRMDLVNLIFTLDNTENLYYVSRIGERLIYEVRDPYPLIYAAPIPKESSQAIYSFPNDRPKISSNPVVSYSVVSPVSYEVHVQNATAPFVLVFGNTFDSGWELEYNGPAAEHLLVYGFANGWLVDKTGSFSLKIHYAPQRTYAVTAALWFVGLALPISLLAFDMLRRKKKAHA